MARTFALLSVVLLWQCAIFAVESRPFNPKKHTTSPSKHHHGHHKNAVVHPRTPASLREVLLGSHKGARDIVPFHFAPADKQAKTHHKAAAAWAPFRHNSQPDTEEVTSESAFGPVVDVPAASGSIAREDGSDVGAWGLHGHFVPVSKGTASSTTGSFGAPVKQHGAPSREDTDDAFDPWGSFQPVRHTGFGGGTASDSSSRAAAGGTSKAIHMVPGEPPRVVEESLAEGDFGTMLHSDHSEDGADAFDGSFLSFVPYPEPHRETAPQESSSSDVMAGVWGMFRDRKSDCSHIVGLSCSSNMDCLGCSRPFKCSSSNVCQQI